jgi:tryptophanyl-tRNA synthetase
MEPCAYCPASNLRERFTFGNYLGAVKNWVAEQHRDAYYCIADLHVSDPADRPGRSFRQRTYECGASLIAAGLDPVRCTLFLQSPVPFQHAAQLAS